MQENPLQFHRKVNKVLRPLAKLWMHFAIHLDTSSLSALPEQFLLISNHVTNFDPFMIEAKSPVQMYFVATDHIFGLGWISKLIVKLVSPIPRPKGAQAAGTILEIKRRLHQGGSVALFAEGNCSWDGLTASFPPATGKMVRSCGVPLVTCRIRGGYLNWPRWALHQRKGPVRLEIAHIYPAEECRSMKPDEINAAIAADLAEDAIWTRQEWKVRYTGRKKAEGIENILCVCPRCHAFGSFSSKGDRFFCRCGLEGRCDDLGQVLSDEVSFTTMPQWNAWQKEYLASLPLESLPEASDPDMVLYRVEDHIRIPVTEGTLCYNAESFRIGDFSISSSDIHDMAVRLKGTVTFSTHTGDYYELRHRKKKQPYHGLRYVYLFQCIKAASGHAS